MRGARYRLLIFPCAGASASSYAPWTEHLPPDLETFVLQMPGRSDRFREAPMTDLAMLVDEISRAVQPLLDRPFVFFGHSLGALLAFETARSLRRRGAPLPMRLFAAGRAAPQVEDRDPPMYRLNDDDFVARMRSLGGIPDEVVAEPELVELVLPALRADVFLHETYTHVEEPRLPFPITALGGATDDEVSDDMVQAWSAQTASDFRKVIYPGGHFFVHEEASSIVGLLFDAFNPGARAPV